MSGEAPRIHTKAGWRDWHLFFDRAIWRSIDDAIWFGGPGNPRGIVDVDLAGFDPAFRPDPPTSDTSAAAILARIS